MHHNISANNFSTCFSFLHYYKFSKFLPAVKKKKQKKNHPLNPTADHCEDQ